MDIINLEEFIQKTGVKVKVLHKIDTKFANTRLYRKETLKNFVEDYVRNPLASNYEALPLSV